MSALPCADRCPVVAGLIVRHSRTEIEERAARVGIGLTPVYAPLRPAKPAQTVAVCRRCTHVYFGARAAEDAENCALGD